MAVFSVHVWKPVPGRAVDLLGSMARAKAIFEANGGLATIWQSIAGGQPGSLTFTVAYGDQVAYGRTMDAVRQSSDFQTFWAEALADPSGVNVENFVLSDIDESEGLPTEPSTVISSFAFETRPGRFLDHLTSQGEARRHLERLGARVRIVQSIGARPNALTTILGFDDFSHYGEFGAKIAVDEQWTAWYAGLQADPPAVPSESAVLASVDVPA